MSHIAPKSLYYTIFASLMVLTIITVGAAFVDLGPLSFPVALAIAIFKAVLVVLFFMHVKYSSRLTQLFVGSAFFFLFILLALTMVDYLTRGWYTFPGGAGGPGFGWGVEAPPGPRR